jgi:hypothetical protein
MQAEADDSVCAPPGIAIMKYLRKGDEQGGWRLLDQFSASLEVQEMGMVGLRVTMRQRQGVRGLVTLAALLALGVLTASGLLWAGRCHGETAE